MSFDGAYHCLTLFSPFQIANGQLGCSWTVFIGLGMSWVPLPCSGTSMALEGKHQNLPCGCSGRAETHFPATIASSLDLLQAFYDIILS